jgi:hypothetical protein
LTYHCNILHSVSFNVSIDIFLYESEPPVRFCGTPVLPRFHTVLLSNFAHLTGFFSQVHLHLDYATDAPFLKILHFFQCVIFYFLYKSNIKIILMLSYKVEFWINSEQSRVYFPNYAYFMINQNSYIFAYVVSTL